MARATRHSKAPTALRATQRYGTAPQQCDAPQTALSDALSAAPTGRRAVTTAHKGRQLPALGPTMDDSPPADREAGPPATKGSFCTIATPKTPLGLRERPSLTEQGAATGAVPEAAPDATPNPPPPTGGSCCTITRPESPRNVHE